MRQNGVVLGNLAENRSGGHQPSTSTGITSLASKELPLPVNLRGNTQLPHALPTTSTNDHSNRPLEEPSASYTELKRRKFACKTILNNTAVLIFLGMQPLQCPAADVSFDRKVGKSTDFYNLWDTLSTDGAWTSQTDLVEKIAFDVKQAELDRDASFEVWENAAVQQQKAQGLSEEDLYVASDTEIFRALAMAEIPVVEDGPTRNTAIVTFPQAALMGAPV
ncbi:uncharacterized protein LOC129597789 isoform X1 [Paramacrobiotus metropolitanus]|uniref:uncharacterized protein LOC129597789 isoform X1 n=1 Tax=Paramacrobiotus metropolitanus TaxID=2943436 RepID=UPI002445B5FB|nr:uncharacterized protein LOC129597789 isoform X1 [Paramacrobiotus metropolitanus]